MATQRAVPGANVPDSGSSIGRKGRSSTEFGQGIGTGPDVTTELPGETGLGSGIGRSTSGFGDAFGTTSDVSTPTRATREFPRAAGVMDQVKQEASTRVNEQKERAADGLGSVASAIRQASEQLRAENQTLASYADKAVDQIQLFADRMRDKDPAEMVRDAERFARRNPAAFVGGAFVLGLALARFLKSSGSQADDARNFGHYDSDFDEVGGTRGYIGGDSGLTPSAGVSRGSDLSAAIGSSTATTDPAPGITS